MHLLNVRSAGVLWLEQASWKESSRARVTDSKPASDWLAELGEASLNVLASRMGVGWSRGLSLV